MSFLEDIFIIICRVISQVFRIILFMGSMIFLLISVLLLTSSYQNRNMYALVKVSGSDAYFIVMILFAIYLIVMAGSGIYCAFFMSKNSVKWFLLLASLNLLISVGVFVYVSPSLDDTTNEVLLKFKTFQQKYDWSKKAFDDPTSNNETASWNMLQMRYKCCGLYSYKDWDIYRPSYIPDTRYPVSCCKDQNIVIDHSNFCFIKFGLWEDGCASELRQINRHTDGIIWVSIVWTLLSVVLIFLGHSGTEYAM